MFLRLKVKRLLDLIVSATMIKFRIMTIGADGSMCSLQDQNDRSGPLSKINDDPRVTFTGRVLRRTSLDELPQFINVFFGTISTGHNGSP